MSEAIDLVGSYADEVSYFNMFQKLLIKRTQGS